MRSAPITIHLIRHGEVYNPRQILYGRLPRFRLSETGRRQAMAAGRHLKNRRLQAVFSSPMLRARQTAEEILRYQDHLKLRISELINEVCTSFEGCPGAVIDARDGDVYTGVDSCFEQPGDIAARTLKFIRRIRHQYGHGEVAAITHGDVVTFMVLWAKGEAIDPGGKTQLLNAGFPDAYPGHASITTLTFQSHDAEERPFIDYQRVGVC